MFFSLSYPEKKGEKDSVKDQTGGRSDRGDNLTTGIQAAGDGGGGGGGCKIFEQCNYP